MALLPLICLFSSALGAPQASVAAASQAEAGRSLQDVEDQDIFTLEDVIVSGRRGAARLAPEVELGEVEIDNLGAYDIGETIGRISEILGLDGYPEIIVNGRRVVNARDFMRFPPDALVRVELLPPEAAAVYGEDPTRRMLNIVLQPEFKSRDGLLRGSRPTAGGQSSSAMDGRQSEISDLDTRQFGIQASRATALRAGERPDYIREHPGSAAVTLRPAADTVSANVSTTHAVGDWSGSLGATVEARRGRHASLVDGQAAVTRRSARSLALTGGLRGEALGWGTRLALQGGLSKSTQDGVADSASRNVSLGADLMVDRSMIDLPAGPVRGTLSGRYSFFQSVHEADAVVGRRSAEDLSLRGSLAVPLTGGGARRPWGDLSMTLGASASGLLDDARAGESLNLGLAWAPLRKVRFNGQWSQSFDAPSDQARLGPIYYDAPRLVFDFRTGEAVEILPLLGGNPDLRAQKVERLSLTASAGPFTSWRAQGRVNFQSVRSQDGHGVVPDLAPAVEAAFPERFIRDANGRLVSIDQRLINIGSARSDSLSSSLNLNLPIGGTTTGGHGAWQVGLNHSWQLASVTGLGDGLRRLDRLADGGGARHQVSLQINGRVGRLGVNAGASWRSAARVRRDSGHDGPDDLRLAPFAAVALRLSYALQPGASGDRTAPGSRRRDGLRVELAVENLFDARPRASLGDGRPAPGYGRDSQDALGRVVQVTLSRRF